MTKLLNSIISWFATPNQQTQLEQYIASKNPQSAAEVDHWMRIYDRRSNYVL